MSEMLLTAYDGAILGPIAKLLGWVMNGVYYLMDQIGIGNVGLSIIIFTIIIYLLLFPLTYKQQKFSKLSQKMQPELNAINKKYQGKKDQASMMAMQQETQAVYEKYGVSMMGSCVQMLIQMPLLFALYRVFMNVPAYVSGIKNLFTQPLGGNATSLVDGIMATEGYQDTMTNLVSTLKITTQPVANFTVSDPTAIANSIVDVTYKMNSSGWDALKDAFPALSSEISSTYETVSHVNNFFGMNISDTPLHVITSSFSAGAYLMVIAALLVPIISYLTQVLNIKLMPQANTGDNDQMARQMKSMNTMMPLMSLFFCFITPTGLGIYWIASAVVRAVQQFFVNKHIQNLDLDDIIKKNQEKAKQKREKMGISEDQIRQAAQMKTRSIESKANYVSSAEKELQLEKARQAQNNAKPGSLASKANMVRDFNEKNKVIVDEIMDKLFDNEFKLLYIL